MDRTRTLRWLALVVIVAAGLQALDRRGGHRFLADEYARGHNNALFNLIPAADRRPLQEYPRPG